METKSAPNSFNYSPFLLLNPSHSLILLSCCQSASLVTLFSLCIASLSPLPFLLITLYLPPLCSRPLCVLLRCSRSPPTNPYSSPSSLHNFECPWSSPLSLYASMLPRLCLLQNRLPSIHCQPRQL